MMKKWEKMSFTKKLLSVNIITILLVIIVISLIQTNYFTASWKEEGFDNLTLMTNQVSLNFDQNQANIGDIIYSRLVTFEIPSLMGNVASKETELKYALAQMVTHSTVYDYVMLENTNGSRMNTGSKYMMEQENLSVIQNDCNKILDTYMENKHGSNTWFRYEDNVYMVKDIYDTMPMKYNGRMVVHMRGEPFKISDVYTDKMFLFYDKNGNYLTYAGVNLIENPGKKLCDFVKGSKSTDLLNIDGIPYFAAKYTKDNWTTIGLSTLEKIQKIRIGIIKHSFLYGSMSLCLGSGLVYILLNSVVRKLKKLQESMNKVANGGMGHQLVVNGEDDISQLAKTFNYMSNRISELLEEVVQKERARKDMEIEVLDYKYRSLQTQIRPHFIYNALECIASLAKLQKYSEIVESVQRISRYFRNITVNTNRQFITVEQELNSLRDYTEIYSFIHGNKLETVYSAREQAKNAMIPTMLVQPIVENALKYGIRSQEEKTEIRIHAYKKEDKLYITVKDNGYGLSKEVEEALLENQVIPSKDKEGIGLANVKKRLAVIYGDQAAFEIKNRPEGGVVSKIMIPFTYSEPEGEMDLLEELEELDNFDDLEE